MQAGCQEKDRMEVLVGIIGRYFNKIGVAVVEVKDSLSVGDTIHIIGNSTDFSQRLSVMQIENAPVQTVAPGDEVAIKVRFPVRDGDDVYKVVPGK
jgi:hypothetical protein